MLSFQSTLSRVLLCIILQLSLSKSSFIVFVLFYSFSNWANLALGIWFNQTRLASLEPRNNTAFLSSSNGLNKTLTYFKVPLHNSRIARVSWLVIALWLRSSCYKGNELSPDKEVILLWLTSSFLTVVRSYSSLNEASWLYERTRTYIFLKGAMKDKFLILRLERLANCKMEGSSIFNRLMSKSSFPSKSRFSFS